MAVVIPTSCGGGEGDDEPKKPNPDKQQPTVNPVAPAITVLMPEFIVF